MDELETGGKLESAPGLVTVGAGIDGMARLATVPAEPCVKPAAAFVLGEWTTDAAGGINLHGGGGGGSLVRTGGGGVLEWPWRTAGIGVGERGAAGCPLGRSEQRPG